MSTRRPDFPALVRTHAKRSGTALGEPTVEELALHLEAIHDDAVARGATPGEALAGVQATLEASPLGVLQAAPVVRGARGSWGLATAVQAACRQFRRHRGLAAAAVLMLGVSVGGATAVFTVVDAVVLRPLPFDAPERLVVWWDTHAAKGLAHEPIAPVNFMDQRGLPVFADAAAWWRPGVNLVDPGLDPLRVSTVETSGNLFALLGVPPQVGAGFPVDGPLFHPSERIIVISDRLWRHRYGGDPAIVGRTLLMNRVPYTVVGVMPPRFHFPDDVDVWQRLQWDMAQHSRAAHFMEAVGRLAPGVTHAEAQAALDALSARWQDEFARTNRGWGARVAPLLDEALGYYRPGLLVLFGASGLLLLIGIFNVASLLLTRAIAREREIATRMALGASARQVVLQLFGESLALSLTGAVVGAAAAVGALALATRFTPVVVPRLDEAAIGARSLGMAAGIVAATTGVFGLVPALLLLRRRVSSPLRDGGRGTSRRGHRLHAALVAAQVALACALLAGSALLVRTVRHMMDLPLGVDATEALVATVQISAADLGTAGLPLRERWRAVARSHARLLEAVRRQPGVSAAGSTNALPMETGWRNPFRIDGEPPPARAEDAAQAQFVTISDGFVEAMGARLVAGRGLTAADDAARPGVVLVNQTFARQHLGERAVGRTLRMWATNIGPLGANLGAPDVPSHDGTAFEVIGVVADIRHAPAGTGMEPVIYFASQQFPFSEQAVAVRAVDAETARRALAAALREVAPTVPTPAGETWGERVRRRTAEPRLLMALLSAFGTLAALLAAAGIYGLFTWRVAARERELAIRIALGASPRGIGSLVVREGLVLAAAGLISGWALVRAADGALRLVLVGVAPTDGTALAAAGAVILVAALAACLPPALRAMRVDPAHSLRAE